MPVMTATIELSEQDAAELTAWADYFSMTEAEVLSAALRFGLDLRRIEYEELSGKRRPGIPGVRDDDLPF